MKPIRVWWNGHRGNWDHGWLMHLVDSSARFENVETLDLSDKRGAIIVATGPAAAADAIRRATLELPWCVLIHTSDEGLGVDSSVMRSPRCYTWVQYAKPGRSIGDRSLLIGHQRDTVEVLAGVPSVPIRNRPVRWMFWGQAGNAKRDECIEALSKRSDGSLRVSPGFGQGAPRNEYLAALKQAQIVVCPSGPNSPDTFRLYESIAAGCLPIADRFSPKWPTGETGGYWRHVLGGEPFPCVSSWSELDALLDRYAAHPDELERDAAAAAAWMVGYQKQIGIDLLDDVWVLSGGAEGRERPASVPSVSTSDPAQFDVTYLATDGGRYYGRRASTDEAVLREVINANTYEMRPEWFTGGSGCVLDIGANIGAASRFALSLGAKRAVCYEPESSNFAVLLANASGYPMDCHRAAVMGERGEIEIVCRGSGTSASTMRVIDTYVPNAGRQTVQAVTLADAFSDNDISTVDLLKLDCEGAEYGVVASGAPSSNRVPRSRRGRQ